LNSPHENRFYYVIIKDALCLAFETSFGREIDRECVY